MGQYFSLASARFSLSGTFPTYVVYSYIIVGHIRCLGSEHHEVEKPVGLAAPRLFVCTDWKSTTSLSQVELLISMQM